MPVEYFQQNFNGIYLSSRSIADTFYASAKKNAEHIINFTHLLGVKSKCVFFCLWISAAPCNGKEICQVLVIMTINTYCCEALHMWLSFTFIKKPEVLNSTCHCTSLVINPEWLIPPQMDRWQNCRKTCYFFHHYLE